MTASAEPDLGRQAVELNLPSGKAGYAQSRVPPAGALQRADELLERLGGNPGRLGGTDVVEGWLLETHTLGCRDQADESPDAWWDTHHKIHDEYAADGLSCVFGDPSDGYFVTLTPQPQGRTGS